MGKTTLLFRLMEVLRGSAHVAYLFQTQCTSLDLLGYLMGELALDSRGKGIVAMHGELYQALFERSKCGQPFVLIIDEAQNLSVDVLETVRLISNCETPCSKLVQIVLAGQPQLVEKLTHPDLKQLRQRIGVISRLAPLDDSEAAAYIDNRLQAAGNRNAPLFTPSAISSIIDHSQGNPRLINQLCFNSLTIGYALRRRQIDGEIVKEALLDQDLQGMWLKEPRTQPRDRNWTVRSCLGSNKKRGAARAWPRILQTFLRPAALLAAVAAAGLLVPLTSTEKSLPRRNMDSKGPTSRTSSDWTAVSAYISADRLPRTRRLKLSHDFVNSRMGQRSRLF
jgi:general secretion pathway protein A